MLHSFLFLFITFSFVSLWTMQPAVKRCRDQLGSAAIPTLPALLSRDGQTTISGHMTGPPHHPCGNPVPPSPCMSYDIDLPAKGCCHVILKPPRV